MRAKDKFGLSLHIFKMNINKMWKFRIHVRKLILGIKYYVFILRITEWSSTLQCVNFKIYLKISKTCCLKTFS